MRARTLFSEMLYATGVLVAGAVIFVGSAMAADRDTAEAEYRAQRALCESGQSGQARDTCLREAGAALQEARRGRLMRSSDVDYEMNARLRCESQSPDLREACMKLNGPDARIYGSVKGGGTLREVTIRELGEPPVSPVPPERGTVTTPHNVHPGSVPGVATPPPPAGRNGMNPGTGIR